MRGKRELRPAPAVDNGWRDVHAQLPLSLTLSGAFQKAASLLLRRIRFQRVMKEETLRKSTGKQRVEGGGRACIFLPRRRSTRASSGGEKAAGVI